MIAANLPDGTDAGLDWAMHNDRLHAQLARAQNRCKQKANKTRTERSFDMGDQVLLKLQPYAQSTVANHPCPKPTFKFFGPFKIDTPPSYLLFQTLLPLFWTLTCMI